MTGNFPQPPLAPVSPNLARPMPGQPEPVEELLPAQSGPPPIILISNSLTPSTYVKKRSSRSLFGKTRRRGGGLNPYSILTQSLNQLGSPWTRPALAALTSPLLDLCPSLARAKIPPLPYTRGPPRGRRR